QIARDLGIDVELRARRVSACAPAGPRCLIVDDPATSERSARSLGPDHRAWLDLYAMTGRVAERLFPTLTRPLPSVAEARELIGGLPRLRCGVPAEHAFAGTFRLCEHEDEIATAYREAAAGEIPARPPAELYCHTLTDRSTLGPDAPPGRNSLTLFGLHTPAS